MNKLKPPPPRDGGVKQIRRESLSLEMTTVRYSGGNKVCVRVFMMREAAAFGRAAL